MTRLGTMKDRLGQALPDMNRRNILIGGGAAAGLALAWGFWPRVDTPAINIAPGEQVLGTFLKIGTDGHITVLCPQAELGQGSYTMIAHLVADELGADWRTVAVEPAPLSSAYANRLLLDEDAGQITPRMGVPDALAEFGGWRRLMLNDGASAMLTGGSTSMRMFEAPVRESAALARALLCMAAADRWDVDWQSCEAADGFVTHGQQRLRFGDLAAAAALLDPPSFAPLRAPGTGPLVGQSLPRLDLPSKIDGSFNFAGDVRLPDMVFASIRQGPIGDSSLKRYDLSAAGRVPGFISAVRHGRWVAAIATNSWAAQRALNAMNPTFSSIGQRADSAVIDRRLKAAMAGNDGARIIDEGAIADAFDGRTVLSADYVIAPALHAQLETRTATAAPDNGRMRLWFATQAPGRCRAAVAAALGVSESNITVFPMPGGGNSGASMAHDIAIQAALIAQEINRPVQLCWSRTEDILQDSPRPPARAKMRATLSTAATIDGWHASIATQAARHEWHARLDGKSPHAAMVSAVGKSDAAAISGARPPYTIPHLAIDHLPVDSGLPAGYWRSNGDSITTFLTECFIDELAAVGTTDPLGFRMSMLGNATDLARCLQTVSALGGWEGGAAGSGQGIACASLRGSHIAVMAVARPGAGGLVVERLVIAADIGRVLNPGLARQAIESGAVFGLAAAVGATTRYRKGIARARHMGDLGLPTLAQMPAITVELIDSQRAPGGASEIGVVAIAPAIANALHTVTGRRIRRLPLSEKPLP